MPDSTIYYVLVDFVKSTKIDGALFSTLQLNPSDDYRRILTETILRGNVIVVSRGESYKVAHLAVTKVAHNWYGIRKKLAMISNVQMIEPKDFEDTVLIYTFKTE